MHYSITTNTIKMQPAYSPDKIALATSKGTRFFMPADIIRLEASSNYTNIYFTNNTHLLSSKVLKLFVEILEPYGFIRTHRAHLINRQHISFVGLNGNIIMQDSSVAEISRRKKGEIMKALKN